MAVPRIDSAKYSQPGLGAQEHMVSWNPHDIEADFGSNALLNRMDISAS